MPDANTIVAPWTDEQVETLNAFQRSGFFHPFTCGERDERHQQYRETNGDRDDGLLVAYNDGWRCPVCDWRQNWAHSFMADAVALQAQRSFIEGLRASSAAGGRPEE